MTGWSQAAAVGRPLDELFQIVDGAAAGESIQNPMAVAVQIDDTVGLTARCVLLRRDGFQTAYEGARDRPGSEDRLGVYGAAFVEELTNAGNYAIACAEAGGGPVVLLEKSPTLLAKVRISGGGRCNVTHACFDPSVLVTRYPRGGRELRARAKKLKRDITAGRTAVECDELVAEKTERVCIEREPSQRSISDPPAEIFGQFRRLGFTAIVQPLEHRGECRVGLNELHHVTSGSSECATVANPRMPMVTM
jgi:hypothetical protein